MERTHTVIIYEWNPGSAEDSYGKTTGGWELVMNDVPVNLQALTGSVEQSAAGRQVDSTYRLFAPPDAMFFPDAAVIIKEILPAGTPYRGPAGFRVTQVGSQGGKWDIEVLLKDSSETVP